MLKKKKKKQLTQKQQGSLALWTEERRAQECVQCWALPATQSSVRRARAHASLPTEAVLPAQTVSALPCDVTKTNPSAGGASVVVTGSALLKVGPHSGRNWWRVWRSTCVPKKEGPSGEMGALMRFSSQRPLGLVLFPKLLILTVTWGHLTNTGPFPRPQK